MKSNASIPLEPRMAWELRRHLTKLSLFLWDCYEEEFLKFWEEERGRLRKAVEEDLELKTPF